MIPRWGEGTEFRSIRWRNYKYVAFRNAPALFFNLDEDPGEQTNLLIQATGSDKEALAYLQAVAAESMDFDAAEAERINRDAELKAKYPSIAGTTLGNQYLMPNGTLVEADDTLYRPDVVSRNPAELFADWPELKCAV